MIKLGHIVELKVAFLDEPPGTLAYVYEEYGNNEVSLITESGVNLGGFSIQEQQEYLVFMFDTKYKYQFKNVIKLDVDFSKEIEKLFLNEVQNFSDFFDD